MPDTKSQNFLNRFFNRDGKGSLRDRVTNNEKKITLLNPTILFFAAPTIEEPNFFPPEIKLFAFIFDPLNNVCIWSMRPLGVLHFLLQYIDSIEQDRYLSPTASYFQSQLMNIYGVALGKN